MNTRPSEPAEPWSLDQEDIRQYAYELYLESGRIPGHDLENWLTAESRLNALLKLCRLPAPCLDRAPRPELRGNRSETSRSRRRRSVVEWGDRRGKHAGGLKRTGVRVH